MGPELEQLEVDRYKQKNDVATDDQIDSKSTDKEEGDKAEYDGDWDYPNN